MSGTYDAVAGEVPSSWYLELKAENATLREGIETYLLWEPGRAGHAEAHRKLASLLAAPKDGQA